MAAIMAAIMEITENIMRRMREPSTKLHNALYFMSGMMVVILALVIVAGVKTKAENAASAEAFWKSLTLDELFNVLLSA